MDQSSCLERTGNGSSAAATPPAENCAGPPEHPADVPAAASPKKSRRGPLLWGMGGTILSGLGFIGLALFEQYNGMLMELRSDLKHFNEISSELVKKESLQRLRDQLKERFKQMEDASLAKAQLEAELRTSEKAREEMTRELQRMRERLAFLEGCFTTAPKSQPPPYPSN